uniref:Uncharacterized protein n=1 Tax=Anguilla anguilla TaxID=7936 RepID=A0A0E9RHY0_ANGAN
MEFGWDVYVCVCVCVSLVWGKSGGQVVT